MRKLTIEETAMVSGGAYDIGLVEGIEYSIPIAVSGPPGVAMLDGRFNGALNASGYDTYEGGVAMT